MGIKSVWCLFIFLVFGIIIVLVCYDLFVCVDRFVLSWKEIICLYWYCYEINVSGVMG